MNLEEKLLKKKKMTKVGGNDSDGVNIINTCCMLVLKCHSKPHYYV